MADSMYNRNRPISLDEVVGQEEAVKTIRGYGKKIPNAVILIGASGTGKTTLARIMSRILGCDPDGNTFDYLEVNCGRINSPLATIQDIDNSMRTKGLSCDVRVYLLDEVQTFSRSKGAQEALLKILEDGPNHAYFFLCTTDPKRLLPTVIGRCAKITCKAISEGHLTDLIKRVAKTEQIDPPLDERLIDKIVDCAGGSARTALVELEKVAGIPDHADRMAAIVRQGAEKAGFDLAKALLPFKGEPNWTEIAGILEDTKAEEPESVRAIILGLARSALLKGDKRSDRAYKVIRCLDQPFYDPVASRALLAAGCYEIVHGER